MFLQHSLGWFCVLIAGSSPAADLSGFSGFSTAGNMKISVYSENSQEPEAVWTIHKVSLEHRRLGFFSVKLLPVVMVDGIQLQMTKAAPQTNWLEGFRCEWLPATSRSIFEWRDFSIFFPSETEPRLHARYAHPVANAGSLICRIEDVRLQTGAQPLHLPRAEVRTDGIAGEIVWQDAAATIRWDLFSGQFTTNSITQGIQNEKP
jgi:hypothetical protein